MLSLFVTTPSTFTSAEPPSGPAIPNTYTPDPRNQRRNVEYDRDIRTRIRPTLESQRHGGSFSGTNTPRAIIKPVPAGRILSGHSGVGWNTDRSSRSYTGPSSVVSEQRRDVVNGNIFIPFINFATPVLGPDKEREWIRQAATYDP